MRNDLISIMGDHLHDPNGPPYEEIERALWRSNAQDVPKRLDENDANLMNSIQLYANRFGFSTTAVEEKLREDSMFANCFAKDPKRTTMHETCAQLWLVRFLGLEIIKLPPSGKNALYVSRDGVIGTLPEGEKKTSKSLDFHWTVAGLDFYATHKYVKQSGGAQDGQIDEVTEVLRRFSLATNTSKILFAIGDGEYVKKKMGNWQVLARPNPPRSYAVSIREVPEIMKDYTGLATPIDMLPQNRTI